MPVSIFKLSGEIDVNVNKAEANLRKVDRAAKQTQGALTAADAAGKRAGNDMAQGFSRGASSASGLLSKVNQLKSGLSSLKVPSLNFGGGRGGSGGGGFDVTSLVKGNLITSALSAATGGLTDQLKEGWRAGIEYNKMLEKASISFTTLLGSTEKAQSHLKALQQFGESTPFEFPDLIKASQRMQAMGFAADNVIPSLRAIGDAVSAVGGGKEELDGVVLALGQMQTKGKVSAEEMNQLAERGIPAWDLLAKAIGKTKEETIKLSEQGRLNGGRAVQGITAMMGERFGGQMDKMSATLEGQESNFNDILNRRLGEATKGNTEQLKNAFAQGARGLNTGAGGDFAKRIDELLTKMGGDFTSILQKFASGEYFLQGISSINFGEKAVKSFNEGDAKGLISNSAQALGMKQGAAGEDQTANAIADSLVQKPIFSREFDAKLIQWITGALQATEKAAREGGKLVGIGTGESIKEGTATALDAHSPSRVMMALGHDAMAGFGIGFNNAVDGEIDRNSAGIKKWAKAIAAAGGEEFLKEVERIAANLKIDPNKLMNVMAFESGLDPSKKNPNSSATGLIQFMNSTATQLGTTTAELKSMNAIEQLKYVEAYFKQFKSLVDTQEALYTAVLAGRSVSDPSSVLFSKGGKKTGRAYSANSALDADKDGSITAAEATAKVLKQGFLSTSDGATATASALDYLTTKLSELKASAMDFLGFGSPAPKPSAAIPRSVAALPQQKTSSQTVQGGNLGAMTISGKAEALTLSADAQTAASAIGAMTVPTRTVAVESVKATEAMKTTGSQAGQFADAIMNVGKATKEAVDHFAGFKDAFASGIDDIFDGNFDAKSFGRSLLKGLSGGLISSATGGAASSPGEFLSKALFGGLSGGSGGTGGGFGGGVPATGGFAGGGGAADMLGKAQSGVGLFQQGGMLSKLPGLGKVGGFLKGLPGIGGALGKIGGLLGFGGGGAAAGAAGAAAGAGGAASGGIMGALLPGLMSNPFTAIAGIGLAIGAPLLGKLFGKDPLDDYRKHIKSEYGIDIKSKAVLGKVMQAGQSKFGAEWQKRKIETVRLPEIRDMLSEYSGAFQKGGNSNLFDSRIYSDAFSSVNQIKVGMINGGRVPGATRGYDHVPVMMDGGELVISNDQQRRAGIGRGGMFGKGIDEILSRVAEALDRFESMPAEQVVVTGIARRPGIAAADVRRDFELRGEHSKRIREISGSY